MELGLSGRRALITGASSGLGLACARSLAQEGARVLIAARYQERLQAASEQFESGAAYLTLDVTDLDAVAAFPEAASAALGGPVDILIANAGGPRAGTFSSTPVSEYSPALALNLLSTVALCKAFVPAMTDQGWGRVVAITSISVREPLDGLILSNTARAGLTGFLKTLSRAVAPHGVTVNSLQPGLHETARLTELGHDLKAAAASVPTGVLGDPADFGRVAAMLCSDSARFITGVALPVDGGQSHNLQ